MAYTDVITLDMAKTHLRIDDTLTEDDNAITRMINGALMFVENNTNIVVFARVKNYTAIDGCYYVYDAPINTLLNPIDADVLQRGLYNIYSKGSETFELSLNVGYTDPTEVPDSLIEVALEIIDMMYYEKDTGANWKKDISGLSRETLNQYKRFIL